MLDQAQLIGPPLRIEDTALLFPSFESQLQYSRKVRNIAPANLIAYWPLWEASGSVANDISGNARHGSYTGVTLGEAGIGDGRTSPYFDGANDYADMFSASLASARSGAECSVLMWAKVANAGTWTDGESRYTFQWSLDLDNYIRMYKSSANGRISFRYKAGGTSESADANLISNTGWALMGMTVSASGDLAQYFWDGVRIGTSAGLGAWAGTAATIVFGASSVAAGSPWHGYLAHCMILNRALTQAEVATLAVV